MTLRVDKALVPEMNVPTRLRLYGKYDYIPPNGDEYKDEQDGDCTFETTMINNIQDVNLVSDMISIKNGEEFIYYDVNRNKTWAEKVAEESGASTKYVRSDNASIFLLVVCQILCTNKCVCIEIPKTIDDQVEVTLCASAQLFQ